MKKTYDQVAKFVRWGVAGLISLAAALPALISFGNAI